MYGLGASGHYQVMQPFMDSEHNAGVANDAQRYLLIQDNLDSQKQPDYIDLLKFIGLDDHKVPPNETDQVQPVDRGLGQHLKLEMGNEMDLWLEDDDNLALWEGDDGAKLSASDRRILLAHWYFNANKKALKGHAKWAYFPATFSMQAHLLQRMVQMTTLSNCGGRPRRIQGRSPGAK